MTAKEFLRLAWKIEERIDRRIEERERLMQKLNAIRTTNMSGMPRGGNYDWTNAADAVIDMDRKICDEIKELCRIKTAVIDAIDAVEVYRYRQVLEMRYRYYMPWDEIAAQLKYDPRHVQRLHGEALLCVRVPAELA